MRAAEINADAIGVAAMSLGAGRATKESEIDLAAGLMLHKKVGEKVAKGDLLVTLYANDKDFSEAESLVHQAYKFSSTSVEPTLIHETITE